ncbi:MAG: histidine phosphatase family protein [Candidatus Nanoarchaeia archaeon]
MKLFLVRHGETIENKKGIIQGHLPGRLSKKGKEQAGKLALRLKNEKFDIVYSSDLARAADTAKAIMKYHKGMPIIFSEEIREVHLGEAAGKKKKEIDWNKPIKGAEKYSELRKRAKKFLYKIHKKHKNTVLIVGHDGINVALISVIMKKPFRTIDKKFGNMPNTALSVFIIDEKMNHKIKILNCAKHLEK